MKDISQYLESTILKPNATNEQILKLWEEANTYNFRGICVAPYFLPYLKNLKYNRSAQLITVVGYPMGYHPIASKIEEAKWCIQNGADEIDMVVGIAAMLCGDWDYIQREIDALRNCCKNNILKVIIETGFLSDKAFVQVCKICSSVGVDYVKTSTGMNTSGAQVVDVRKMRTLLPGNIKIKASGGIRSYVFASELIEAGADSIGTSSALGIFNEKNKKV